jgi:hypothetical protein
MPAQEFQLWREQVLRSFFALFPQRLDTIVRPIDGKNWRTVSRFYSLSDEDIQESISRSTKLLRAVIPGDRTRFAVLTIAAGSELYDAAGLTRVKQALESIGVTRTSLYKASGSDDWQIFIWWSEWVKASELEMLLAEWLDQVRLSGANSLFVFPGAKPLPLPLQVGFAWLDDQAAIATSREVLSLEQAVESLLGDMANNSNDWEVVSQYLKNPTETILDILPMQEVQLEQSDELVVVEAVVDAPEHLFDEKGTDRESVVIPEEIAACESMQQLSLFSVEASERGPPV